MHLPAISMVSVCIYIINNVRTTLTGAIICIRYDFCALARGVDANVVDNGVSITHSRRDSNGTRDASRDSQKQ